MPRKDAFEIIRDSSVSEIKKLVDAGKLDVNYVDKDGDYLIHVSVIHIHSYKKNKDILEYLIKAGANVNAVNSYNSTPLHYASYYNLSEVAKILIDAGADVDVYERDGDEDGYPKKFTPLLSAVRDGFLDTAKTLIAGGANVNVCIHAYDTPLHIAADNSDIDMVKLLIDAGADVNANSYEKDGIYPIHEAANNSDGDIIKLLIESGAKRRNFFDYMDKEGNLYFRVSNEEDVMKMINA